VCSVRQRTDARLVVKTDSRMNLSRDLSRDVRPDVRPDTFPEVSAGVSADTSRARWVSDDAGAWGGWRGRSSPSVLGSLKRAMHQLLPGLGRIDAERRGARTDEDMVMHSPSL
jgi:hypothetical protein